jgi:nitrate/nitrite transporter NarK
MLFILLVCSLFRGSQNKPSLIGVNKCDPADHVLFALLILCGAIVTVVSATLVRKEYFLKESLGYDFVKGELKMTRGQLLKLVLIGFTAGFLNAGFGLGSTFVINPMLIKMELPPLVAGNTGIFMSLINNISSTIAVIVFGRANIAYGVLIGVASAIGAYPGILLQ